jgi:hypothetical protein
MDPIIGSSFSELGPELNRMEDSLEVGGKARLEIVTYDLPSEYDLESIYEEAVNIGMHLTRPKARIVEGLSVTSMVLTKGSPMWAALIPLLVPLGVIGLITFGITQIETISKALLPLILASGGLTVIALGIMRKPAERAAEVVAAKYAR